MSRQTQFEWELKQLRAGLCTKCKRNRAPGSTALCQEHLEYHRRRNELIARANGIKPWKKGGRGRPPKT